MGKFVGFLTDSVCQESGRHDEDIPDQTPGDHQFPDPLVRTLPLAGINILPSTLNGYLILKLRKYISLYRGHSES